MLIIAIPKSASTSLATSLCELHGLENATALVNQRFKHRRPDGVKFLHNYHALPTIDPELARQTVTDDRRLYKLHAFPTDESVSNLRGYRKVVLLRDPHEIVLAEKRATESLIHSKRDEFSDCATEEQWLARAEELGLYDDLHAFYDRWSAEEGEHTLLVHYANLIEDPQSVVNAVESFMGLPVSPQVQLKKERYSGASRAEVALQRGKRLLKKIRRRVLQRFRGRAGGS